jgi:ubiquinone/menaquinone biosynthesis C-methylase UbiE
VAVSPNKFAISAPNAVLFSQQSAEYAQYRPEYPTELFQFLAKLCYKKELAVDCGTGTGQAAVGLAGHFINVVATDLSHNQIDHAFRKENIRYLCAPAEATGLPDHCADIVTAAVSVHWFDLEKFYTEVKRIARPNAVIAIWSYNLPVSLPEIDQFLAHFFENELKEFRPTNIDWVYGGYQGIYFPFDEIICLEFSIRYQWDISQLLGYLWSWSSVQRYIAETGHNPLISIEPGLKKNWKKNATHEFRFDIHLKAGRIEA